MKIKVKLKTKIMPYKDESFYDNLKQTGFYLTKTAISLQRWSIEKRIEKMAIPAFSQSQNV